MADSAIQRAASPRRDALARLGGWLVTGPLGHLYGTVVDVVLLWARYLWARARRRPGYS